MHDALGVLADVQDRPFDISVPARPAWTCARAGLYTVAKSRRSRITLSTARHDLAVVGRRSYLDVAQHYEVSSSTFYDLVNAGCDAIVETFPIVFDMSERSLK